MYKQMLPAAALTAALAVPAMADVHLSFSAVPGGTQAGDTFTVTLRAVGDGVAPENVTGVSAVFGWDPGHVSLVSWTGNGDLPFSVGMLFPEGTGINEADPPADGDAFVVGFGGPSDILTVPAKGSVEIGTLEFRACTETKATAIDIIAAAGPDDLVRSSVFGDEPGEEVTGSLVGTTVQVVGSAQCGEVEDPCPADVTGDNDVNVEDIIRLFLMWDTDDADADVDGNGIVGVSDVLLLVSSWGPCEGEE
jgi:hypothetical protein